MMIIALEIFAFAVCYGILCIIDMRHRAFHKGWMIGWDERQALLDEHEPKPPLHTASVERRAIDSAEVDVFVDDMVARNGRKIWGDAYCEACDSTCGGRGPTETAERHRRYEQRPRA